MAMVDQTRQRIDKDVHKEDGVIGVSLEIVSVSSGSLQ